MRPDIGRSCPLSVQQRCKGTVLFFPPGQHPSAPSALLEALTGEIEEQAVSGLQVLH